MELFVSTGGVMPEDKVSLKITYCFIWMSFLFIPKIMFVSLIQFSQNDIRTLQTIAHIILQS